MRSRHEHAEQQHADYHEIECPAHLSFRSTEALQMLCAESSKKPRCQLLFQCYGPGRGAGVTHRGRGCVSTEPTYMRPPNTRRQHAPRWSWSGGGVKFGSPASIAGLPRIGTCVSVGPP